jgi:hypothetical protein
MDYSVKHSTVVPHPRYPHHHQEEVLEGGDTHPWRNDTVEDSGGTDSLMPLIDDTAVLDRSRQDSVHHHPRLNSIVEVRQVVTSQQQV